MNNVAWQFQAAIPGGPALTLVTPQIAVAAYDVVNVTIAASATGVAVPIQPSTTAGNVILLVISSSQYDAKVTYTVDGIGTSHVLDGPHVLVGAGAVSLLNAVQPPQTLTFDNTLANDINLQIVVGRKTP